MSMFFTLRKRAKLCDAFERLSSWTWDTLRDGERYRLAVGEPTITELLLLSVRKRFPTRVFIHKYSTNAEGKSGADWLWCFVGAAGCFVMQVQAKRIYSGDFRELAHQGGKPKKWQVDVLIGSAATRKVFPAYVLYSYLGAPFRRATSLKARPSRPLWGCSAGSAELIRPSIKAGNTGFVPLHLSKLIYPWRDIVCLKKKDVADSAHAFAKRCVGIPHVDGWFANCINVPSEVVAATATYVAMRAPKKGANISAGDGSAEGILEPPDHASDEFAGVALFGDLDESCLVQGL